jgi:hypothetical protein
MTAQRSGDKALLPARTLIIAIGTTGFKVSNITFGRLRGGEKVKNVTISASSEPTFIKEQ